jgi:hypothetical protein
MNQTIKRLVENTRRRSGLLAAAVAVAVGGTAGTAHAQQYLEGKVTVVEYSKQPLLLVQLSGGHNFYAHQQAPTLCTQYSVSADTIKAWQNLAQAALLSGRTVRVYYYGCGGQSHIQTLDLNSW